MQYAVSFALCELIYFLQTWSNLDVSLEEFLKFSKSVLFDHKSDKFQAEICHSPEFE